MAMTVTCTEVRAESISDELRVTLHSTDENLTPIADDLLEQILNGRRSHG